jgi:hypothetical protein
MDQNTAKTVINKVICTNFKVLANTRIKFVYERGSNYYMAVQWKIFYFSLFIDVEILNFSVPAFKGCLGHELVHILEMEKLNVFERLKEKFTLKSNALLAVCIFKLHVREAFFQFDFKTVALQKLNGYSPSDNQ